MTLIDDIHQHLLRYNVLYLVEINCPEHELHDMDPNALMMSTREAFNTEVQVELMQQGYLVFIGFRHMIAFVTNPFNGAHPMEEDYAQFNASHFEHR